MAKKLYIQTVKPVVEVSVVPEGTKEAEVIFGFKVHGSKATKAIAEQYEDLIVEYRKLALEAAVMEKLSEDEQDPVAVAALNERLIAEIEKLNASSLQRAKEDISYVKKAVVKDFDEYGEVILDVVVEDSRKVEPLEGYWDTPAECLEQVVSAFLDNKVWEEAILKAHQVHMSGSSKEAQVKN